MTAILVTRPAGARDPLVVELESRGYRVSAVPTVAIRAIRVNWPDASRFDWIVLTSAAGVNTLPNIPEGPRIAAVGEATAGALRERGAIVDLIPPEANGAALASSLPDVRGLRVLIVQASMADRDLGAGLRARGALVEEVTAYETIEGPAESAEPLVLALSEADLAGVVFASGSAVRGYLKLGGHAGVPAITIGPRTTAVARAGGFTVLAEASTPGVEQLAQAVQTAIPIEVGRDA